MMDNKTPQEPVRSLSSLHALVAAEEEISNTDQSTLAVRRNDEFDSSVAVEMHRSSPRHATAVSENSGWVPQDAKASWNCLVAEGGNRSPLYQTAKRTIDIVGSLTLILLTSPILIGTWLALRCSVTSKPIFVQMRVGKCGKPFRCLKFRTMVENAESIKHLIENEKDGPIFKNRRDPRITGIGRILRTTSIDEAPQLFNVLMGHMSLVGPRPPIPEEVEDYTPKELTRLSVKPGLTCLWQVSGRSLIDFDNWMEMDIWYVENQSLKTDLSLLARTPFVVLTCRGAY